MTLDARTRRAQKNSPGCDHHARSRRLRSRAAGVERQHRPASGAHPSPQDRRGRHRRRELRARARPAARGQRRRPQHRRPRDLRRRGRDRFRRDERYPRRRGRENGARRAGRPMDRARPRNPGVRPGDHRRHRRRHTGIAGPTLGGGFGWLGGRLDDGRQPARRGRRPRERRTRRASATGKPRPLLGPWRRRQLRRRHVVRYGCTRSAR